MLRPAPPLALRARLCGRAPAARILSGFVQLLLGGTLWATAAATPRSQGDLTGPWQLLADDHLVADKVNVRRTYHPFVKYPGNPVVTADRPWEGRSVYLYGTVLPGAEGRGYRMWYHGWAGEYRNLYATSEDGIAWTKPDLGLIEFNGSRANNLFLRRTREDHLPQVIHTPWERRPDRHYKLVNYDYGRSGPGHTVSGFWGACSSDGLHWTDVAQNPVLRDPGDVGHFVWDPHQRRYAAYPKIFAPVRGYRRRSVGFTATRDFEHWPSAQLILTPDEDDDRWVKRRHQRTEFYGLCGFAYESAYLGFLWIFRVTDGDNDGPIYPELVSSRDGIRWTRPDLADGGRVPILPLGPKPAWDSGMIFTPSQPLVEGGLVKLWYGGIDATHGGPDAQARGGIGLATLRKDGFASLDAGDVEGAITTRALKHLRGPLRLNADARRGSILVEILTADGRVLPGYGRAACDAIGSDGLDQAVTWGPRTELPGSNGPLRLRFVLRNASLYSFMAGPAVAVADLAEAQTGPRCALTFEESPDPGARLRPRIETIDLPEEGRQAPYVLLEPEPPRHGARAPLLIYLYGAGGSHEDYNLMRPPYDRLRQQWAALGYFVMVPELGPSHWMNAAARRTLDRMVDQAIARHPIDPQRIAAMGTSMGGGSALAYAIARPDRVRAVCSHLGMTDFAQWLAECPRYWGTITQAFGGSPVEIPAVFQRQSAMANLEVFANLPVFLVGGETDQTVLPQQGQRLADALAARGYHAVYREAKGLGHEDRTIVGFEDEVVDFFRRTLGPPRTCRLRNHVQVANAARDAAFGTGAAVFPEGDRLRASALELCETAQLGPRFTLAAMVRTNRRHPMRLFSNHRGSGEFVSGELVFDFDPGGTAFPGLRFLVNGLGVLSEPVTWDGDRYHHLAATYDHGRVALYFDGIRVGRGHLPAGTSHLYYDRTVLRHFDQPEALPAVGIHLASNLRVGGDADAPFVTYQDEVPASVQHQFNGFIDDVLVARLALTAAEIRRLSQKGLDLCKLAPPPAHH